MKPLLYLERGRVLLLCCTRRRRGKRSSSAFCYAFLMFFVLYTFDARSLAESYYKSDFIKISDAEKKWGYLKLDTEVFKSGDLVKRAPMAVDIVKQQLYVGKRRKTVRDELGDPDSYFFSDTIYAYKIMPYPGEGKEIWHLVFIPDDKLEKVKEVKIHKKCCYRPIH